MEFSDQQTPLDELKKKLSQFRDERDWVQFHKPKDLAMAISIEANELLERFLWKSEDEIYGLIQDPESRQKVVDELADVFITAINFVNAAGVDISRAVLDKIEKNALKYPVDKAKGSAKKYDQL